MDGCGRIIAEFGTQLLVTLRWHKRIQEGKGGRGGGGETRDTSSFAVSPGKFWFDLAQPKAVAQHGLTRPYLNYKKIRLSL